MNALLPKSELLVRGLATCWAAKTLSGAWSLASGLEHCSRDTKEHSTMQHYHTGQVALAFVAFGFGQSEFVLRSFS